jgi:peptidoglycan/LPS O-acetylase OafA/YrhL
MKSSSGEYYVALDHLRALAALLVFAWHFIHSFNGSPVPFEGAPAVFPLALFDEGHVGVALFMTLSGYLFAKLLDKKVILYRAFFLNRALRLLPLLLLVVVIVAIRDTPPNLNLFHQIASTLLQGLYKPVLPNGGWSITVEFHFYLLLPLLLYALQRDARWLLLFLALGLMLRSLIYFSAGEVQSQAYWKIIGRLDQFVLGILAFYYSHFFRGKHLYTVVVMLAFMGFYWHFAASGGFYKNPSYPSPNPIWIALPTIEGTAFACLTAYYDTSFKGSYHPWSRALAAIGTYSYSIYLLHVFWVFSLANWVHTQVLDLSNFYVAFAVAILAFIASIPICALSYYIIERPFLSLRRRYAMPASDQAMVR